MDPVELAYAGVARQAELVRSGEVSSVELVELVLARIERLNPLLGAFTAVDGERALAAARANGAPGWISNQHSTAFEAVVYRLDYGRMVGSVGFEPTLDTV